MSNNQGNWGGNGGSWNGPNGTNAEEFRKQTSVDATSAQKHNPFTAGKGGPPVFYRSKTNNGDECDSE